jgi:hypothetical protein
MALTGLGGPMATPAPPRPRDEEVVAAIASVFARFEKVETQRKLRELVEQELRRRKPGARVAGPRIRVLAVRSGLVRLEMRYREGDGLEGLEACPVCQGKVKRVKNRTLSGGQVLVGLRCPQCGYKTGRELETPARYVFHRR